MARNLLMGQRAGSCKDVGWVSCKDIGWCPLMGKAGDAFEGRRGLLGGKDGVLVGCIGCLRGGDDFG